MNKLPTLQDDAAVWTHRILLEATFTKIGDILIYSHDSFYSHCTSDCYLHKLLTKSKKKHTAWLNEKLLTTEKANWVSDSKN